MQKAITAKELAKVAGVSVSTVSRAYSTEASCNPATRQKIMKLAGELGYAPSPLASALTTKKTKLIGLVVNNFQNPFFIELFEYFTRELQAQEYGCLIVSIEDGTNPTQAAAMLLRYSVDGMSSYWLQAAIGVNRLLLPRL